MKLNHSRNFINSFVIVIFIVTAWLCSCNSNKSGQRIPQLVEKDTNAKVSFDKSNYNIYIENSGSMDGYVATESDFKNSVYGLITDLKAKDVADKLNLFYINDSICTFRPNALPDDIVYFIRNLNPTTFRNNGCGRKSSYIPDIIKRIIMGNDTNISILFSDYIFSSREGSSTSYLTQQKYSVQLAIANELKKHDFSTIIFKFNSQFNGKYYIESNKPTWLDLTGRNARRPYYAMVFGRRDKLNGFLSKIKPSEYNGFENSYYLLTPASIKPNAKIIRDNRIGDFEIDQPATQLIINNVRGKGVNESSKVFQFSIAVNLEFLKIDDSYLLNPGSYEVSNNYSIVSIYRNKDETNESLRGYTHVFTLKTVDVKQVQDVTIKLKSELPDWVGNSSNVDDSDPLDSLQETQTFGFKYLIEGISKGYSDQYEGKEQFAISIKVSKDNYGEHGRHSSFPWWIILIFIGVVGLIIWLKNKK